MWGILLDEKSCYLYFREATDPVTSAPLRELLRSDRAMEHTVTTAQWSLSVIHALELIRETLP